MATSKLNVSSTYFPVLPSHNLTDLSNDALAISLVSGENATSLINCWCPVILAIGFLSVSGCHRNRVKSSEPVTSRSGWLPWIRNVHSKVFIQPTFLTSKWKQHLRELGLVQGLRWSKMVPHSFFLKGNASYGTVEAVLSTNHGNLLPSLISHSPLCTLWRHKQWTILQESDMSIQKNIKDLSCYSSMF